MFNIELIAHVGYFITFTALAIRDVLFLRIVLSCANVLQVIYQFGFNNNSDIALWNALFLFINTIQVIKIIKERSPIKLPDSIEDIYKTKFSSMAQREFLYFWNLGAQKDVIDSNLIMKLDLFDA